MGESLNAHSRGPLNRLSGDVQHVVLTSIPHAPRSSLTSFQNRSQVDKYSTASGPFGQGALIGAGRGRRVADSEAAEQNADVGADVGRVSARELRGSSMRTSGEAD